MLAPPASRNPRNHLTAMIKTKVFLASLALQVAALPAMAASSSHDLYLAAAINRNYVVGSKIVTVSGLFKRAADGTYQHFGVNFPYIINVAIDPRDPKVIYAASINGILISRDGGENWRIG